MTECTYFDATGKITGTGMVNDDSLEALFQMGAAGVLLEAHGSAAAQYVAFDESGNPSLAAYTEEERAALAALQPGWVWQMPERVAVDARELSATITKAVVMVDREADAARAAVVGDPVRVKEYERAQAQAEAFRDANFSGTVPPCVACWATAKEWTAQQATEDILAASARWLGALDGIRALRLQTKEDIRRATTNAQVDTLLATFTATLTAAMQGVQ